MDGGRSRPAERERPRVAVIGGGLSGAAFATHLMRDHPALPVLIDVIEPRDRLGAGLAYGTTNPTHRVNVAASRLSLFPENPVDLETWLDADGRIEEDAAATLPDGRRYPQRALYGAYVADTLGRAAGAARSARLRHLRARAAGARPRAGGGYVVRLSTGEEVEATVLLLATGHPPPRTAPFLLAVPPDRLVADPWAPDALDTVASDDDVLVVGTGLTGCDVIASLRAHGHRGRLTAISRRGLLPRPRTTRPVSPFGTFDAPPADRAIALLRRVRAAMDEASRLDRPWEDVVDALRAQGAAVWNGLPVAERKRLLRHLRPFWDVHRFQSAPQIDRAIADALLDGSLRVRAGSIRSVGPAGMRLRVEFRPRNDADTEILEFDRVVDCTGPGHRTVADTNPFLAELAGAGLIRADETRLGLDTDRLSRAINAAGEPAADLFVLGPLARAAHGELMGLPQVTIQPRAVASEVATLLVGAGEPPAPDLAR